MSGAKTVTIISALVLFLVLTSGCTNNIFHLNGADYPSIDHRNLEPDYVMVEDTFSFQDREVSLKYYIDRILYEDAKNTDKYVYLYDEIPDDEWSAAYYRSFVENEYMDEVNEAILVSLRQVKDGMSLDDDEYAELLSVYVQSIPYKTDDVLTNPKYPVETVYDNSGDCDDKSILLAGLLLKEGYDVVLLEFGSDEHMNVGIKSPGCQYKDTGYATIETTDVNLIGWEKIEIGDDILLDSTPLVIGLGGEGGSSYSACSQVQKIFDVYEASAVSCGELTSQIEKGEAELDALEDEIHAMNDRLEQMRNKGDISGYNRYVPDYNSKVNTYQDKSKEVQSLVNRYNECVGIHNKILEQQYDRKGLYEYVQSL